MHVYAFFFFFGGGGVVLVVNNYPDPRPLYEILLSAPVKL